MKKILSTVLLAVILFLGVEPTAQAATKPSRFDLEARAVFSSSKDISKILAPVKVRRDAKLENRVLKDYVGYIVKDNRDTGSYGRAIVFFVAYGTPSTRRLSLGERAGVIDSYERAFGRLPITAGDWADLIRIADTVRPASTSVQAEAQAKLTFRKIYGREPLNPSDRLAIYYLAYGLRPAKQDAARERAAISRFKKIYGYAPLYAEHWDIVRALAYSGVK